jgi:hypothetical protein
LGKAMLAESHRPGCWMKIFHPAQGAAGIPAIQGDVSLYEKNKNRRGDSGEE